MPEQIVGKCPWCEREDVNLYLITGLDLMHGPQFEYVCHRCIEGLKAIQEMRERRYRNGDA